MGEARTSQPGVAERQMDAPQPALPKPALAVLPQFLFSGAHLGESWGIPTGAGNWPCRCFMLKRGNQPGTRREGHPTPGFAHPLARTSPSTSEGAS